MRVVQVDDAQSWDQALLSLPNPHVLESWAWGEFKSSHGWRATRLLFLEEDRALGAASVLERKLPGLPVSILYVPKGPAVDWYQGDRASLVLAELERLARRRRALFLKIDPDVYYPEEAPVFSARAACAPEIAEILSARGWRFSGEQIQYRNTLLLDLSQPEETLLAGMKQKTRYNVRLASRRGVAVRPGTERDLDLFYQLYAETSRRDGFLIRQPRYYVDAWSRFLKQGQACLLLAEVEGEAVAGLMLFRFGPSAWYMYGASSDRHRQVMPNQLLQWEAIRWAKAAGCLLYDLWGAPDHLAELDPMWGVVQFKRGLGGQLARGLGAWDYPTNRLAYRLYSTAMPLYLRALRRGSHGTAQL